MSSDRPRGFNIRRLSPEETQAQREAEQRAREAAAGGEGTAAASSPRRARASNSARRQRNATPPLPTPPAEAPASIPEAEPPLTGGLFADNRHVLAFIGAVASSGLTDSATLQRGPKSSWWTQVAVSFERVAPLIQAAHGLPFACRQGGWFVVPADGRLADQAPPSRDPGISGWPQVGLLDLLAGTSLLPGTYSPTSAIDVLTPGVLARWILGRAVRLGLNTTVRPVRCHPFDGTSTPTDHAALLVRIRSSRGSVPAALVQSLVSLPYTIVAPAPQEGEFGLTVDVRHRLPCPPQLVSSLIDQGELWIIGPPELGRWRLVPAGQEVDASAFVAAPDADLQPVPPLADASLPEPAPLRLVRQSVVGDDPIDAVLLDETELNWVRTWLSTRPFSDLVFLLPGDGRWLLTAPGGLPAQVPFGIPMTHSGPMALYLELGLEFRPPLPDAARIERFSLTPENVVALTAGSGWRFQQDQMIPAWTLWVGPEPELQGELPRDSLEILKKVSALCSPAELQTARRALAPRGQRPVDRHERVRLLEQAMQEYLANNLLRAAELLEAAGCPGQAGRLYERAAASS